MYGWMDDLPFYVLFNSILVTSGRWADDNRRLCAMDPRVRLSRPPQDRQISRPAPNPVGQRLTH